MMTPSLIEIPKVEFKDDEVIINFIELKERVPFEVKRIYTIHTRSKESIRGRHAHLNQEQIIFMLQGTAQVELTNATGQVFRFVADDKAIHIPPRHWIEIRPSPNAIMLCLASLPYNEVISVFDKNQFFNTPL
jgi:hypothetical protein